MQVPWRTDLLPRVLVRTNEVWELTDRLWHAQSIGQTRVLQSLASSENHIARIQPVSVHAGQDVLKKSQNTVDGTECDLAATQPLTGIARCFAYCCLCSFKPCGVASPCFPGEQPVNFLPGCGRISQCRPVWHAQRGLACQVNIIRKRWGLCSQSINEQLPRTESLAVQLSCAVYTEQHCSSAGNTHKPQQRTAVTVWTSVLLKGSSNCRHMSTGVCCDPLQ